MRPLITASLALAKFTVMFSAAAVASALLAALPVHAASDGLIRIWSDGPMSVVQVDIGGGQQACAFGQTVGQNRFTLAEYSDGAIRMMFRLTNGQKWTSGGTIHLTTNGNNYPATSAPSTDGSVLIVNIVNEGSGRDFLHDLWNGDMFTVDMGTVYQQTFPLTGSANAIAIMHRCASTLPGYIAPATTVATIAIQPAPVAPAQQPAISEVGMLSHNGVKHVRGVAGSNTVIMFVLDSGAGDVQLPRAAALDLALEGALTATGRKVTFINADGVQTLAPVYILRSLTVGERTVHNVECNLTDNGDPLLGQSFLGRLKSWSIDNAKQTLVLGTAI